MAFFGLRAETGLKFLDRSVHGPCLDVLMLKAQFGLTYLVLRVFLFPNELGLDVNFRSLWA